MLTPDVRLAALYCSSIPVQIAYRQAQATGDKAGVWLAVEYDACIKALAQNLVVDMAGDPLRRPN